MADEITAQGKYLLISVPEFAADPVGPRKGEQMSSFIRLGAFHEKPENDPAMQRARRLADYARVVSTSQGGHINDDQDPHLGEGIEEYIKPDYGGEIDTSTSGVGDVYVESKGEFEDRGVFLDDQRIEFGEAPPEDPDADPEKALGAAHQDGLMVFPPRVPGGTKMTPEEFDETYKVEKPDVDSDKLEQSKALYTRGGWWDHSDGNRISTTYGDKIEVVRGNYKMVVLGRQPSAEDASGWDVSGGHMQDTGASMPGASVRVEYRKDEHTGAWHLENTTNGFIQTSDYAGDFFEHWYGNKIYNTIGSEEPQDIHPVLEKPYGNPHLLDKTWASKIESYTGSKAWRIPDIVDETYAVKTSSVTDVSSRIEEKTYCDGTIRSVTGAADRLVPVIEEETYAVATVSITNVAGAIVDVTNCTTQTSTTVAGACLDITLSGLQEELAIHGHHGSVEIAGHVDEAFIGTKLGVTVGWSREWNIGSHESFDIPDKKALKLKELDTTLERLHMTMMDKKVSAEMKYTSLAIQLQGMLVAIGM